MELVKVIAAAIKKADNTYFFEDYTKQARSVMNELGKKGLVIVPREPTKEMLKAGVLAINIGNIDARILAKNVYTDMIEADD
jgi:hypothetical protein